MRDLEIACELGVSVEEFWMMIPREFGIYVKNRYKFIAEQEEREAKRSAFLAMITANFSGVTKRRYKVSDFLPKKKATGKQMFDEIRRINAILGGEEVKR